MSSALLAEVEKALEDLIIALVPFYQPVEKAAAASERVHAKGGTLACVSDLLSMVRKGNQTSATIPANQIPTKPGFYWVRRTNTTDPSWAVVQVVTFHGTLGYQMYSWEGIIGVSIKRDFVEWGGECVPPTL